MPVPANLIQTWGFSVKYTSHDNEPRHIDGKMMAERMDTVYRYMQRKFTRLAKTVEDVHVWDLGYMEPHMAMHLQPNEDGSITAFRHDGTEVCTEIVGGKAVIKNCTIITPYSVGPMNPGVTYATSWKPKEVFPALTTYSSFEKVKLPNDLHKLGGDDPHRFKAKFYELFPREK